MVFHRRGRMRPRPGDKCKRRGGTREGIIKRELSELRVAGTKRKKHASRSPPHAAFLPTLTPEVDRWRRNWNAQWLWGKKCARRKPSNYDSLPRENLDTAGRIEKSSDKSLEGGKVCQILAAATGSCVNHSSVWFV